jgi:uncharacterized damage-inducible protein DinB
MKSTIILTLTCLFLVTCINSQNTDNMKKPSNELPYHQIPAAPESITAGNVLARTVDGLGYRYYWATEGLTEKDYAYKPSEDSRSAGNTLEHLYHLSQTIVNAVSKKPNIRPREEKEMSQAEMRAAALKNFKMTSDILRNSKDKNLEDYKVVFQRGEKKSEFPLWNLLNGPLADAIYHTGQIVAYRRASGNPIHHGVNVFIGKTRE